MSSESLLSDREPPQFLSIPKRSGGVRRLTVLGPEDARAYGAEVARASGTIERALGPEVFANRARPGRRFALEPWGPAWRRFVRARQSLVSTGRVVVKADVRECYPSIHPKVVERMLLRLGCRARDVGMLRRWLDGFQDLGVSGLPIGPEPSAVLANAVLAPVDGALR